MQPVTIESLCELRGANSLAYSPEGSHIAYVATSMDPKKNAYRNYIWVMGPDGQAARQLTAMGKESAFCWESEETILFLASRTPEDEPAEFEEKSCIYRINIHGGEAVKAFDLPYTVTGMQCMREGLVFTALVDINKPGPDASEEEKKDYKDYHILEEVPFWANGASFIAGLRARLFYAGKGAEEAKPITPDNFAVAGFEVRGGRLLYWGSEYEDMAPLTAEAYCYDFDAASSETLIEPGKYYIAGACLLESQAALALSDFVPWGLCQAPQIYFYDFASKSLSGPLASDTAIGNAVLSDALFGSGKAFAAGEGDRAYFIGQRAYRSEIYLATADSGIQKAVSFDGIVAGVAACGSALAFSGMEKNKAMELYVADEEGARRVSDLNGEYFAKYGISEAKALPFTDSDGVAIDGFYLEPAAYVPGKKYPAVLEIHGGPRCAYGEAFFHEMQALAGAGYFVLYCNPRGSEGYGNAFADLRGRYGTVDYTDLMEFVDCALSELCDIDPARLACGGGSYGGFMANWIEGHTDRFAAICSQRSISNWVSDYGNSEIGYSFDANEMAADPWSGLEKMWEQSPLKYADKAVTPILFIHSLMDYNCPVTQGFEMFTAMKRFGVPSKMVLFEKENHNLSRSGLPRHRLYRLREIIGWFDKYCKTKE